MKSLVSTNTNQKLNFMKLNELCKSQLEELKEKFYWQLVDENIQNVDSLTEKTTLNLLNERYGDTEFYNDDFFCTAGMGKPVDVQFIVISRNGRIIYKEERLIEQDKVEIYAEGLKNGLSSRVRVSCVNTNYLNF